VSLIVSINSLDMIREVADIMSRRADVSYLCGGAISVSGGIPGLGKIDIPFNFSGRTRLRN
jgi:hypothetical protein